MKKIISIFIFISILLNINAQERAVGGIVPLRKMIPAAKETVPPYIDNSKLKYFPPVINQIGGSCAQAANVGYMFTYEMNRLLDRAADKPENRFSYLYSWNFINDGQNDGSIGLDGIQLALSNGIITEKDFPAQTSMYAFYWASGYEKYLNAMKYRSTEFQTIDISSPEGIRQVKQFLYNRNEVGKPGGIVTFSTLASAWKIDESYNGPSGTGYHCLLTKLASDGPHAMTIVGYDDLVESTDEDGKISKGAFIVINSWGELMHDKGRFYLPYRFFLDKNRKNSELSFEVNSINVEYREPRIVFKVEVECDSRNDLSFRYGVANKSTDRFPAHEYRIAIANYQGGDYNMQGAYSDAKIEFGFDFSDAEPRVNEMAEPNYFLNINRDKRGKKAATIAVLKNFEVLDYRSGKTYRHNGNNVPINSGQNLYNIPTVPLKRFSRSPVEWLRQNGQPVSAPLIIRTRNGKYAKMRLSDYDRTEGKITVRYVCNLNGDRRLK